MLTGDWWGQGRYDFPVFDAQPTDVLTSPCFGDDNVYEGSLTFPSPSQNTGDEHDRPSISDCP